MQNAVCPTAESERVSTTAIIKRIIRLSTFDGDSAAALRAVHGHLSNVIPGCSLALVLVRDLPSGQCRLAGLIGADGREHVANVDPFGQHTQLPSFEDALVQRILADATTRAVEVSAEEGTLPFALALLGARALLGVPVITNGTIDHWLVFGSPLPERFARIDHDAIVLETNLATSLIVRPLTTRALRDESSRQRQAIEGLADVQRLLLPDNPQIRGLEHAVHWQPADTAAGDYYDLMALTHHAPAGFVDSGHDIWALMLADVSGHGAAAAMEAVQFDAILRTYGGDEEAGPAGAITYANRYFFSRRTRHHFLTAFAVLYRPDLRRATYVAAGHPPLLHRRGNTVTVRGNGEQIPLGILRDHVWDNRHFDVEAGDILVLYTDGIIEARSAEGVAFGSERLIDLVGSGPQEPANLLDAIRSALFAHQGSTIGSDDQTVMVLRVQ